MMTSVLIFLLFYLYSLFSSRIIVSLTELTRLWYKVNEPGLIHHLLHLKMPVPSQEYDSCPFVFDVFCHLILPCD